MKNVIVIIITSVLFALSVQANPSNKAKNTTLKQHHGYVAKNKIESKKNKVQESQKKKIDITIKKRPGAKDKSTNWTGKKKARDFEKDKNNVRKSAKNKHEKASRDFHKWSNKTQDSIESGMKRKDPKYQPADPFYNERQGQPGAF